MSDIKEKIAKQLMTSTVGLLSNTLSERLNVEKQIINDTLEEMRKAQDVKKGTKVGLENYRWTMTDTGRLNYRVIEVISTPTTTESPLTQPEKTPVETPQASRIVEESPLEQKQDTTSNMFDWTDDEVDNFAEELFGNGSLTLFEFKANLHSMFKSMRRDFDKQITSKKFEHNLDDAPDNSAVVLTQKQFTPEKVRDLLHVTATGRVSLITQWLDQNQPEPVVVGLSDEQINEFFDNIKSLTNSPSFRTQLRDYQKKQTFTQSSEADKAAIEQLRESVGSLEKERDELQNKCELLELELKVVKEALQFNWDDAPDDAVRTQIVCNFLDAKGIPLVRSYLICEEQRPKPTPQVVEVGQVFISCASYEFPNEKAIVIGIDSECVAVEFKDMFKIRVIDASDFLAKFERVS